MTVAKPVDFEVGCMDVATLMQEVQRARDLFRKMLSSEGDDLCWRDAYEAAAAFLPEPERQQALERLKTCSPRWVMLGNCDRFITSLKCDEPYVRLGEPPLTTETAKASPVRAVELYLRLTREIGRVDEHYTGTSFQPGAYAGSFRGQKVAHDCLTRLLEAVDAFERTGVHKQPNHVDPS